MKRLLLLGAGHAHVHVLRQWARAPVPGVELLLVSPYQRQMYSGMVPGWMAGRYRLEDCAFAVEPLAAAASAHWHHDRVVALDAASRQVLLGGGARLSYDLLSLDTGSVLEGRGLRGAAEHALRVRPIETFAQRWTDCMAAAGRGTGSGPGLALTVVVVGAGAAGVELALAAAARLRPRGRVVLVTGGTAPLDSHPLLARSLVARALRRAGVTVMRLPCAEIGPDHVHLQGEDDGRIDLPCQVAIVCTGGEAPRWLPESGLQLDGRGFIATGPMLQSLSHPEVFAAGDVASRADAVRPRSGVQAVRAGPALADNLMRALQGKPLRAWQPPVRTLNLLACGDGRAIASWGPLAASGRWAMRWKDAIDRRFIAGLQGATPPAA